MNDSLLGILFLIILAAGCAVVMLLLSTILGPKSFTEKKDDPFECGTIGSGSANERFGVKFYLVAMIFILFDIETVFIYPWVVNARELGWHGFSAMLLFIVVLSVGLRYIWKRGVLDWNN